MLSFAYKGEITCLDEASNMSDFILNDDFYQNITLYDEI